MKNKTSILFIGIFIFLISCENDIKEVYPLMSNKLNVEEVIGVESFLSQGGVMRAKLTAPLMLRIMDTLPRLEFPNSLHVNFFDSTKKVESQLDAQFGKYLENQNLVFLKDKVIVFNTQKDTLWTNELWWDQNQQKFYTDKAYVIKRKGDEYYQGVGMEASQDLKTVTLKNMISFIPVSSSRFPD